MGIMVIVQGKPQLIQIIQVGRWDLMGQTDKIIGASQEHRPFGVFVYACYVAGELAEPGQ